MDIMKLSGLRAAGSFKIKNAKSDDKKFLHDVFLASPSI
jgi:hypothetical protein